jgi:hypothetical protein
MLSCAAFRKTQPYSDEGKRFKAATAPQLYDDSASSSHFLGDYSRGGKATRSDSVVKSGHLPEE